MIIVGKSDGGRVTVCMGIYLCWCKCKSENLLIFNFFLYTEINAYTKVLVHFAILLVYFLAFRCHTYRFNYVVQSH